VANYRHRSTEVVYQHRTIAARIQASGQACQPPLIPIEQCAPLPPVAPAVPECLQLLSSPWADSLAASLDHAMGGAASALVPNLAPTWGAGMLPLESEWRLAECLPHFLQPETL